jgi:two-component system OmpR family response regulator
MPSFALQEKYMVKVLIIEDDSSARLVTKLHLRNEYQVVEASDGMEAMELLKHQSVDLIIADVMMPKMNGYEFVEQFRMMDKITPVLLLTAKKEWKDKKMGFAIGIDDYMTKPVNYEELQWRIRALLRRAKISNEKQIIIGDVVISEDFNMVVRGEEKITLPKKEFELLFKLLSYPNKIFTVSQILDNIWGYDSNSDETTVRTHINRLRKKFADWNEFEIVTIRGLGYRGKLNE